jgi:hypothetical protein
MSKTTAFKLVLLGIYIPLSIVTSQVQDTDK